MRNDCHEIGHLAETFVNLMSPAAFSEILLSNPLAANKKDRRIVVVL